MQKSIENAYVEIVKTHFGRTPPEDFKVVKHIPSRNGAIALCIMWEEYRVFFITQDWTYLAALTLGYGPGTTEQGAREEFDVILETIGEKA